MTDYEFPSGKPTEPGTKPEPAPTRAPEPSTGTVRRHAIPVGPPPPPQSLKIAKEDRLEAEVLAMKIQNVQLQLQIMQSDLQKALAVREELVAKMNKLREDLLQKYNVDIAAVNIADDGTVTPHNIKFPGI